MVHARRPREPQRDHGADRVVDELAALRARALRRVAEGAAYPREAWEAAEARWQVLQRTLERLARAGEADPSARGLRMAVDMLAEELHLAYGRLGVAVGAGRGRR